MNLTSARRFDHPRTAPRLIDREARAHPGLCMLYIKETNKQGDQRAAKYYPDKSVRIQTPMGGTLRLFKSRFA
jgi:hypothetical protein